MIDELALRALAAGLLFAALAAPLGVFVVWRRMAYFGEALAHSALLGVGAGLFLGLASTTAVLPAMLAIALLFVLLERHAPVPTDTLLGILAHGALAAGVVLVLAHGGVRVDLLGFLFGDILATGATDLLSLVLLLLLVGGILAACWRGLLSATASEELAQVEGVNVRALRTTLVLALALTVAVGMRLVGVLLVMTLLIVPAAAARPFVRTPETMVGLAILIGGVSVTAGLVAAFTLDWPAGPSIGLLATVCFFASLALRAAGGIRCGRR